MAFQAKFKSLLSSYIWKPQLYTGKCAFFLKGKSSTVVDPDKDNILQKQWLVFRIGTPDKFPINELQVVNNLHQNLRGSCWRLYYVQINCKNIAFP